MPELSSPKRIGLTSDIIQLEKHLMVRSQGNHEVLAPFSDEEYGQ